MVAFGTVLAAVCGELAVAAPTEAASCVVHRGHGWAPTEHHARLKAWEAVAQRTGNWPFQRDALSRGSYRCRQDRGGILCRVGVRVCRGKA
jgi:hypothetical protein